LGSPLAPWPAVSQAPAPSKEGQRIARASTSQAVGLRWLYGLVLLPVLTDMVETGRLAATPRQWITEIVAGLVIVALVHRVRKQHSIVVLLARIDGLTGLWNRRAFDDTVEDECAHARRSMQPLSLVYLDIDHFKLINDREGHARGDEVLQQLAAAIIHGARARVDRGFRIGGDEFALLLPGSTAAQAEAVIERVRNQCEQADAAWTDGPLGLCAGIVEFDRHETAASLVRRADAAMYRCKASRR
jgi:diguanylate cyclase (GGDEF)-like protein